MNWDQFEGKWKQMKGSVKQKWGKLTDDDLTQINGKKDQLIGRIQERYGMARNEAETEADRWWTEMNKQDVHEPIHHR